MKERLDALDQELKQLDVELANPEKFQEMSKKEGFFEEYQQKQQKLSDFMKIGKNILKSLKDQKKLRSQF